MRSIDAMTSDRKLRQSGPMVTLLVATYNRPALLGPALRSAAAQTYRNLQIVVIRDGGEEVRDVVEQIGDDRIRLIDRARNRGLPHSYNEALDRAEGEYIAYLGDDDIHYPTHIETLVRHLEGPTDCQVAYTDLYAAGGVLLPDRRRRIHFKSVVLSRDFDRFFTMHFNQALGGSLMHRRDLLERAGPYCESLRVMIDWDLTRRLAFFTDFLHIPEITGEFFVRLDKARSDRISDLGRRKQQEFEADCMRIRNTRPPKPWPKMPDTAVVLYGGTDEQITRAVVQVSRRTFMPYRIFLPRPAEDLKRLNLRLDNVVDVPVRPGLPAARQVDAALETCDADYVAVLPAEAVDETDFAWVEGPLHARMHSGAGNEGILLGDGRRADAALFRAGELRRARRQDPASSLAESLEAARVRLRPARTDELPFRFDEKLAAAHSLLEAGDFLQAARRLEEIPRHTSEENVLWSQAAWSYYYAGGADDRALALCRTLNRRRPTVRTLALEGKLLRRLGDLEAAKESFERAEAIFARTREAYREPDPAPTA